MVYAILVEINQSREQPHLADDDRNAILQELNYGSQRTIVIPASMRIAPGESAALGIGIRNNLHGDSILYVHIRCDSALSPDRSTICNEHINRSCAAFNYWLTYTKGHTVSANSIRIAEAFIRVPKNALPGLYSYRVMVCTDLACTETYDDPLWLRVTVA